MPELSIREPSAAVRVIAIEGDITSGSEQVVMDAYARATGPGVRAIVLDFARLDYMNSGGIGLLVMLLVRAQRAGQLVFGCALSDHYREIFGLTRLDEVIALHPTEADAIAAATVAPTPDSARLDTT